MDPFEAFGSGDNSSVSQQAMGDTPIDDSSSSCAVRDPDNGVLTHHDGTEQALLQYVKTNLDVVRDEKEKDQEEDRSSLSDVDMMISRCEKILSLVDSFCRSRHWMMHVGDEKGRILQEFLTRRLDKRQSDNRDSFGILEMGTYCGYSTILMAKTCLENASRKRRNETDSAAAAAPPPIVRMVTVDVNPTFSRVAQQLIQLANMDRYVQVSFVLLTGDDNNDDQLTSSIIRAMDNEERTHFDFCFIDHDKDMYLPDLLRLERSRLVRSGTFVCADNVVFFRLDKYRNHLSNWARRGVVTTKLVMSRLEYVLDNSNEVVGGADVQDGLGAYKWESWGSAWSAAWEATSNSPNSFL